MGYGNIGKTRECPATHPSCGDRGRERFCIERYGERPLDYIERLGWLERLAGSPMASISRPMKSNDLGRLM